MKRIPRALLQLCLLFAIVSVTASAHAYTWMIRHGYDTCSTCHVDPSGNGLLTAYGRAQGELLLRTRYPGERSPEDEAAAKPGGFLWGAAPLPDWLLLQADLRGAWYRTKLPHADAEHKFIQMRSDLMAAIVADRFRAAGSLGYAHEGALGAALTRREKDNLVSREHWLGYALGEDSSWLVRAGRMNLPFGIRTVEHTLWARQFTRTQINDAQQTGAALAYSSSFVRAELMGIAGNFQLRPDRYRERGYSGFAEFSVHERLGVGASSLITHADADINYRAASWRHAHGAFVRYAPIEPLVLLGEADFVLETPKDLGHRKGGVGFVQADYEIVRGVHAIGTFEGTNIGKDDHPDSWSAWLSCNWFFAPHADLRVDGVYQSLAGGGTRDSATALLLQAHLYL